MCVRNVLILGAGPCGLSTAIALAKQSSEDDEQPLQITLVEVRPEIQTIGGTVNLTPLAMRYLDYLGVGDRIRSRSISLDDGLDYVSLRTGWRLANIWGNIGCRRIARYDLVSSLMETLQEDHPSVQVQWGKRVTAIDEQNEQVVVEFEGSTTTSSFEILLGCDGIHSAARLLWVEPGRTKTFTGRVSVMGWSEEAHKNESLQQSTLPPKLKLSNGQSVLRDTVVINGTNGILLASYYEPSRSKVYLIHSERMEEPMDGDSRDGWKTLGNQKETVRGKVLEAYKDGRVEGVKELVEDCQDWHLYPIYVLPGQGRWHRGRVLLLGDASHAMPPQGESTGFAIEDGIAFAHVFQRRKIRAVEQLFSDFVALRKPLIDEEYVNAVWAMEHGFVRTTGLYSIFLEYATATYLTIKRWYQQDHFAYDVRKTELPA